MCEFMEINRYQMALQFVPLNHWRMQYDKGIRSFCQCSIERFTEDDGNLTFLFSFVLIWQRVNGCHSTTQIMFMSAATFSLQWHLHHNSFRKFVFPQPSTKPVLQFFRFLVFPLTLFYAPNENGHKKQMNGNLPVKKQKIIFSGQFLGEMSFSDAKNLKVAKARWHVTFMFESLCWPAGPIFTQIFNRNLQVHENASYATVIVTVLLLWCL